jgi:cysteine desulfurase / selenocysteine lyase
VVRREGVHPHDVGMLLDREGVAVRPRRPPLLSAADDTAGIGGHRSASLALYNTRDEIDALATAVLHAREMFA